MRRQARPKLRLAQRRDAPPNTPCPGPCHLRANELAIQRPGIGVRPRGCPDAGLRVSHRRLLAGSGQVFRTYLPRRPSRRPPRMRPPPTDVCDHFRRVWSITDLPVAEAGFLSFTLGSPGFGDGQARTAMIVSAHSFSSGCHGVVVASGPLGAVDPGPSRLPTTTPQTSGVRVTRSNGNRYYFLVSGS